MKERSILFSAPMVQAILNGEKTQTRRVVKKIDQDCDGLIFTGSSWQIQWNKGRLPDGGLLEVANIKCPYGKVGDCLWVRESWRPRSWSSDFDSMTIEYRADGDTYGRQKSINPEEVWENYSESVWEALSDECIKANCPQMSNGDFIFDKNPIKWKSAIFMPRAISRILLKITSVKAERLASISEEDAESEGCAWEAYGFNKEPDCVISPVDLFKELWSSIHGKKYSWDSNPWVWVIEFQLLESVA